MASDEQLQAELAEAQAALDADLNALAGLDDDERAALDELTAAPSAEDNIEPGCDVGPHLTDEEWQYILDVQGP